MKKQFLFFIFIFSSLAVLFACQKQTAEKTKTVQTFTGIFYVTGNEPFTLLAFESSDGQRFKVTKQDTTQYRQQWKLQHRKVKIQGVIVPGTEVNEIVIKSVEEIK
jgi:cell shape-determining protein MreC